MPDSVGQGGFPNNINIGHEHLDMLTGFTYQYLGGVSSSRVNWKVIGGAGSQDPDTTGWSTGHLGSMWYNINEQALKVWLGTRAQTLTGPNVVTTPDPTTLQLYDDFISGSGSNSTIGELGWQISGGTATQQASEIGRLGIIRKNTTAVLGTWGNLFLYGSVSAIYPGNTTMQQSFDVRMTQVDADTYASIGATQGATGAATQNGFVFEKDLVDVNWFATMYVGGVPTRVDTTVPVDTNFHSFKYERTATATLYYIDNVLVAAIPFVATLTTFIVPSVRLRTNAGADKTADVDRFSLFIGALSRV